MSDLPKPIAATWARSTLISAVTAGLMMLGVAVSAPASAAPQPGYGEIVGTVTGGGNPVGSVNGYLYAYDETSGWDLVEWVDVDWNGSFSTQVLPGTYRLCASPEWWEDTAYVPTCFEDAYDVESATDIVVADGGTEVASIALKRRPTISGRVTDPDGAPIEGISVRTHVIEGDWDATVGWARTDSNGEYSVLADPGAARLSFEDYSLEFSREFWNDKQSVWTADPITVVAGQNVEGKDATLIRTGSVSGTVTLPEGARSADRRVSVVEAETGDWAGWARVNESGQYTVWGLDAGTYRVEFSRVSGAAIGAAEFYNDAAEGAPGQADLVTLTDRQQVSGVDATIAVGGSVSGVLVDGDGAPLAGCAVEVYSADGSLITRSDRTDSAGIFTVTGLSAGPRLVRVAGSDGDNCDGGVQYYDGDDTLSPGSSAAASVGAVLGEDDALGTLVYERGAVISGSLTLPDDSLVNDRRVQVIDTATGERVARTTAGTDGSWSVRGLSAGSYRVAFSRVSGLAVAAPEFYDDIAEGAVGGAHVFDVGLGDTASGVDATLVTGGTITGVLKDSSGAPLDGCNLQAYTLDGHLVTRGGWSHSDGSFTIGGLSTGSYLLRVATRGSWQCNGADQYATGSGGTMSLAAADAAPIAVERGADTALAEDLVFSDGAKVTGTVTLPEGATAADRRVRVLDAETGDAVARGTVRADGTYEVKGLLAGSYRLSFGRVSGIALTAPRFYDGVAEGAGFDAGQAFTLTATGEKVANATPALGGTISGHLVDSDSNALVDCYVQAFTADGHLVTRAAWTDLSGDFAITGLSGGAYLVRVLPYGECSAGVQFVQDGGGHLGSLGAADPVAVPAGGDVELAPALVYAAGASISGSITYPAGVTGDVAIEVVDAITGEEIDSRQADESRPFVFTNLAPGSYRIEFARDSRSSHTPIAASYFENVAEGAGTEAATPIELSAGEDFIDADHNVQVGGKLVGSVVDGSGAALQWCQIEAFTPDGFHAGRVTWTGGSTPFNLPGLATGDYQLVVACEGGIRRYCTGTSGRTTTDPAKATTFHATRGSTLTLPNPLIYGDAPVPPVENTTAPAISDTTPQVGQTLTATAGMWNPEPETTTYQWLADGESIEGATESTYAVTAADLGSKLSVEVTAAKADHANGTATSPETTAVAPGTIANTAQPAIDDTTPEVGDTLTATAGTWSPAAGSTAFQWLADGEPIDGATESTYTVVTGDIGSAISVKVTASKDGYDPASETSEETAAVVGPDVPFAAAPVPTITGTVKVGETLTAHTDGWDPQPTFSYQWLSNGQPIAGATSSTYTLKAAEMFTAIQVGVVGTKDGYDDTTRISAGTGAVAPGQIVNNSPATISGAAVVGSTLTAGNGTWTPNPTSYLYQWHANGQPIAGATGPTFTVPASLAGQAVQVGVVAQRDGYHAGASVSAGVPIAQAQPLAFVFGGEPRIVGINRVRRVLSYVAPSISPAPAAVSYQWLRNGVPIAAATNPRYRVRFKDRRKVISLRVTYARAGYATVVKVTNGKRIR